MDSALISVKLFDEATIYLSSLGKVHAYFPTKTIHAITNW